MYLHKFTNKYSILKCWCIVKFPRATVEKCNHVAQWNISLSVSIQKGHISYVDHLYIAMATTSHNVQFNYRILRNIISPTFQLDLQKICNRWSFIYHLCLPFTTQHLFQHNAKLITLIWWVVFDILNSVFVWDDNFGVNLPIEILDISINCTLVLSCVGSIYYTDHLLLLNGNLECTKQQTQKCTTIFHYILLTSLWHSTRTWLEMIVEMVFFDDDVHNHERCWLVIRRIMRSVVSVFAQNIFCVVKCNK